MTTRRKQKERWVWNQYLGRWLPEWSEVPELKFVGGKEVRIMHRVHALEIRPGR